jgi:hypothetical protein
MLLLDSASRQGEGRCRNLSGPSWTPGGSQPRPLIWVNATSQGVRDPKEAAVDAAAVLSAFCE